MIAHVKICINIKEGTLMRNILFLILIVCMQTGCATMPTLNEWVREQGYQPHSGYSDEDILGWEVTFDTRRSDNGGTYRTNFSLFPNEVFAYTQDKAGVARQSFSSSSTLQLGGSSAVNFLNSGIPADIKLNVSDMDKIEFDIKEGSVRRMLQLFPKRLIGPGERVEMYVVNRELRAGNLLIEQFDKNENRIGTGFSLIHGSEPGKVTLSYSNSSKSTITGADILIGYDYEKIELIGKRQPKRYNLALFEYMYAGDAYVRVDGIRPNDKGGYEAAIVVISNGYDLENIDSSDSKVYKSTRTSETTGVAQNPDVFKGIREADDVAPTFISIAEHVAVSPGARLGTPGSNGDTVTFMIVEDVSPSGITFTATDIEVIRR